MRILQLSTITSQNQGGGSKKAGLPPGLRPASAKNAYRFRGTYKSMQSVNTPPPSRPS